MKCLTFAVLATCLCLVGCQENCTMPEKHHKPLPTLTRSASDVFEMTILPWGDAVGVKQTGNVTDLLFEIPYLLMQNKIPSEKILNQMLAEGIVHAGMSGGVSWEPFILNEGEFQRVLSMLKAQQPALQFEPLPSWVETVSDWEIWKDEATMGIPWQQNKALKDQYECLTRLKEEAYDNGDDERGLALHWEAHEAGTKWAAYTQPYIESKKLKNRLTRENAVQ